MRRPGIVFVVLAMAFSGAWAAEDPYSENSDELLSSGARYKWQKRREVMRLLSVRRAERVAEIGAGKGFFTEQFGAMVGSEGRIWAVETDPGLLAHLEEDVMLAFEGWGAVLDASETLALPDELDMVFTSNTWHHVPDRAAWRAEVGRALKPGGRFVIVDWHGFETPVGPPVDHRLAKKALIEEMKAAGWTLTSDARLLAHQYLLIFTPPKG